MNQHEGTAQLSPLQQSLDVSFTE